MENKNHNALSCASSAQSYLATIWNTLKTHCPKSPCYILATTAITTAQIADLSILHFWKTGNDIVSSDFYFGDAIVGSLNNAALARTGLYALKQNNLSLATIIRRSPITLAIIASMIIAQASSTGQLVDYCIDAVTPNELYYASATVSTALNSWSFISFVRVKITTL